MVSLKIANDEHIKEEEELIKENDALKQEIVEINLRHIEEIKNIRLVYVISATPNTSNTVIHADDCVMLVFVRNTPESCGN